jgi:hypothetical protein
VERSLKKSIPKRSWVWKHFVEHKSDKQIAVCSVCEGLVAYGNGTNKMKNHLAGHKIFKPTENENENNPRKKFKGFCDEERLNSKLYY